LLIFQIIIDTFVAFYIPFMKKQSPSIKVYLSFVLCTVLTISCSTISLFDQQAYTQTTSVKVDAMNVMDLATDSFNLHKAEVKSLQTELQKIYEYEKNRPKNEITTQMWDKLLDANGHLLGGFLVRWQKSARLDSTFVAEEEKLVANGFDLIAGLESQKIKASDVSK
jgi:hypothetical protein